MKLAKFLVFFIFLLAFAPLAGAQSIDNLYIKSLTPAVQISPCETAVFEFEVYNLGDETDAFDFGVDPFFDHAKLSSAAITLESGKSQNIKLYLTPLCSKYGSFDIHFLARSRASQALFQEIVQLEIVPNDVLKVSSSQSRIKVGLESSFVEIPLENIGPRDSVYSLFLESDIDWLKVLPKSITLPAQSTGTVKIFTFPEGLEEGSYHATLVAKVDSSGIEYAKTFEIILKEPGFREALTSAVFAIGSFLAGYWWVFLLISIAFIIGVPALAVFFIWHNATKELRKELKHKKRQEKYKKKAEHQREKELQQLESENLNYPRLKKKVVQVIKRELKKEFKLVPKTTSFPILPSILMLVLIGLGYLVYTFQHILIYFKGYILLAVVILFVLSILLIITRRAQSSRLKSKIALQDIDKIKAELKDKFSKNYELIHKEVFKEFSSRRWMLWAVPAVLFTLITLLIFFILSPVFDFPASAFFGMVTAIIAAVCLLAIFIDRAAYSFNTVQFFLGKTADNRILHLPSGWTKGLYEITLKLASKAEHAVIFIQKFRKFPEPPEDSRVYQYFEINLHNISAEEIKFSLAIKNSWAKTFNKIKVMRYTQKWVCIPMVKREEDKTYTYYEAKSPALDGVFAIVGRPASKRKSDETEDFLKSEVKSLEKKEIKIEKISDVNTEPELMGEQEPKKSKKIMMLAVLILFFASFVYLGFYSLNFTEPAQLYNSEELDKIENMTNEIVGIPFDASAGIPPQIWMENTEQTLDLAQFFQDPDGDALLFSASPVEHIGIRFENGAAILVPDFNWYGKTTVVFSATDNEGASIDSNPVQIIVEEAPEKVRIKEFFVSFKPYLKYFLIGVVMVIALLALFEVRKD